ncbi:acyltransferase [Fundidesulfovibrio soli]|uniref:acyltransferase n=1 Tax=Fundidesulfovibrio soli TaxID=2922716 RepID=UPI0030143CFA
MYVRTVRRATPGPPLRLDTRGHALYHRTMQPFPYDAADAPATPSLADENGVHPTAQVHPTACVDQGARVGRGTCIWHFCHVLAGAEIGECCTLGQNVCVMGTARIGNGVKIQNNVSIYDGVVLEDDVFCGPSCVFTNVLTPRAFVCRRHEYRPTVVRRGATLGANSTVVCGHEIGAYAMVAAGAVVTGDVAPHALVMGVPARQAGWVCFCGERLDFGADGTCACAACGQAFALEDGRPAAVKKP